MTKEETAAYSRGYAAGIRRKKRESNAEVRQRRQDALWNRAFLAILPTALTVQGWTLGEESITTGDQRMKLASIWADRALKLHLREVL